MRQTILLSIMLTLCVFGTLCSADVVYLLGQRTLEGQLEEQYDGQLTIRLLNGGRIFLDHGQIVKIDQEEPAMYYVRQGEWWAQQGREDEAERSYQRALSINPEFGPAQERYTAMQQGRKTRQVEESLNQAERLMGATQYEQAIRHYMQALEASPSDEVTLDINRRLALAYSRMAFVYYDHCYDDGARLELNKALEINPNCAEVYYVLGRIYQDDRDLDTAQSNYELALQLDPTHMPARNQLMVLQNQRQQLSGI